MKRFFSVALVLAVVVAIVRAQTPPYSDPGYNPDLDTQLSYTLANQEVIRRGPGQETWIVIIDAPVNPHPDIPAIVDQRDFTGDSQFAIGGYNHGSDMACAAKCIPNNSMGSLGTAGFAPWVKIASYKVIHLVEDAANPGQFNPDFEWDWVVQALTYAAQRKSMGDPISVINVSLSGTPDVAAMDAALNLCKAQGINVVSSAGPAELGNLAGYFPTSFFAGHDNLIPVGGSDGDNISQFSYANPNSVPVAAPIAMRLESFLPPFTGASSAAGTSISSALTFGLLGLLSSYEPDFVLARLALYEGCVPTQGLDGKVAYGRINMLNSLMAHPTKSLVLVTESSGHALAQDSVSGIRDPFPLQASTNFGGDGRTRVRLLLKNVNLVAPNGVTNISVQFDGQQIIPEHYGPVPNRPWLTQITLRLPDVSGPRDIVATVSINGVATNSGIISIK